MCTWLAHALKFERTIDRRLQFKTRCRDKTHCDYKVNELASQQAVKTACYSILIKLLICCQLAAFIKALHQVQNGGA